MYISLQVTFFLFLFFTNVSRSTKKEEEKELWDKAKRELALRTREYVKQNPVSAALREFIQKLSETRRRKRQGSQNMYAISNGEVVPLAQLEEQLNTNSNLGENFTVVPLIIPIPLENNVSVMEKSHSTEDDLQKSHDDGGSTKMAILGRGDALMAVKNNKKVAVAEEEGTEETVVNDLVGDKMKTTTENTALSKVLEDVESLISAQKKGGVGGKEGVLCNVSGHWDSEAGGMTFHIKKTDAGASVTMKPLEPPSEDGFIAQDKWNVTGKIPFPQSAQIVIILTAHQGRRVAMFLGECRVCEGSELITGDWLVGRTSTNCKDQKASHSYVADMFRKNNVELLREEHMKKVTTVSPDTTIDEE